MKTLYKLIAAYGFAFILIVIMFHIQSSRIEKLETEVQQLREYSKSERDEMTWWLICLHTQLNRHMCIPDTVTAKDIQGRTGHTLVPWIPINRDILRK